jgi:gas vesicle protein
MKTIGRFMSGALLGAIVGGMLALLFTPVKGSTMRERISDSFFNIRNEVKVAAVTKANDLKMELARMQKKTI